jgi:hypothetical protein
MPAGGQGAAGVCVTMPTFVSSKAACSAATGVRSVCACAPAGLQRYPVLPHRSNTTEKRMKPGMVQASPGAGIAPPSSR